jgi:hypothetical protein
MIVANPEKAVKLVRAMCVLHNYLRVHSDQNYTPPGFVDTVAEDGSIRDGFWRIAPSNELPSETSTNRSATREADQVRQRLIRYFTSPEGSIEWQYTHINKR